MHLHYTCTGYVAFWALYTGSNLANTFIHLLKKRRLGCNHYSLANYSGSLVNEKYTHEPLGECVCCRSFCSFG